MVDRVAVSQDNISPPDEVATVLQHAGPSPGWVVPADETLLSTVDPTLPDGPYDAFEYDSDETTGFDVVLTSGEAVLDAVPLARSDSTTVTAPAEKVSTVAIGYDPARQDKIVSGTVAALERDHDGPYLPLWNVKTDGSGVVDVTPSPSRRVGQQINVRNARYETDDDSGVAVDAASVLGEGEAGAYALKGSDETITGRWLFESGFDIGGYLNVPVESESDLFRLDRGGSPIIRAGADTLSLFPPALGGTVDVAGTTETSSPALSVTPTTTTEEGASTQEEGTITAGVPVDASEQSVSVGSLTGPADTVSINGDLDVQGNDIHGFINLFDENGDARFSAGAGHPAKVWSDINVDGFLGVDGTAFFRDAIQVRGVTEHIELIDETEAGNGKAWSIESRFEELRVVEQGVSDHLVSVAGGPVKNPVGFQSAEVVAKVGDGVVFADHPSFATAQDAIDFADLEGYGIVRFGAGTYGSVTVPNGMIVTGSGNSGRTIFEAAVTDGGTVTLGANATLADCEVTNTGTGTGDHAIVAGNRSVVHSCRLGGAGGDGYNSNDSNSTAVVLCDAVSGNIAGADCHLTTNSASCIVAMNRSFGTITNDGGTSNEIGFNT